MSDDPVRTTFDWCARGDQFHQLCRRTFTSPFGVAHECDCPEHNNDPKEET